jgi:hypothetical protein
MILENKVPPDSKLAQDVISKKILVSAVKIIENYIQSNKGDF